MKNTQEYFTPTIRQGMKIIVQNVNTDIDMKPEINMFDLRCGKCKNWGSLCDHYIPYEECPVKKILNEKLYEHIIGWNTELSKDPLPMPARYIIYADLPYVDNPCLEFCRELYKEYSRQ